MVKRVGRIRIKHNWKLLLLIIFLMIIFVLLIWRISINWEDGVNGISKSQFCLEDSDCVPKCGCHPDSCVNSASQIGCERVFCTAVCEGPLDCGAGSCGCVDNKCVVGSN
ncbi:hypothetical protein HOD75_05200 [archaeon]|jgi:hypothetical protein|nr:hypothetical protein [Candidatus Woesearchaeota archaeon]MBT4136127.1 hypothetical protein [archaeon]MBT4242258.1 hypothetical protein [archaeon]MBT4417946.1 hypothetical protein [archaeon]